MKEIPLTKGFVALVDDEDYEKLSQVKWCCVGGYARTKTGTRQFRKIFGWHSSATVSMHRLIMGALPGQQVDHKNGKTLDNRKSELRLASGSQNSRNAKSHGGSSKYKGVSWRKDVGSWAAYITNEGVQQHLGLYLSETSAAAAHDLAAQTLHREFARPNLPEHAEEVIFSPLRCSVSGYRGVHPNRDKFIARIIENKQVTHIGSFDSAYDAAIYRDYYIEKHNLTSRLNF